MTQWSIEAGVMELRLNQPPLNEIGVPMLETLERFLDDVERMQPRSVLVSSALHRGFCAGADLRALHAGLHTAERRDAIGQVAQFLERAHRVMDRLDMLPVPTVGAIAGLCFGGGFELALTLDVLIVEPTARFAFPELRLGLIPGFGGIPRLCREVPNAVVRDLLLTGRSIGARRALELGLVSQLVGRGRSLEVARETAKQAACFAPPVVRSAKAFVKPIPRQQLDEEKQRFLELFGDQRVLEALQTFVESRDLMPYLPVPAAEKS